LFEIVHFIMKPSTLCVSAAAAFLSVSCNMFKSAGDPSGGVKTDPYEDVANGGYATGDFYGRDANPYAADPAGPSDRYAQAYGNTGAARAVESYDHVNVIPFTDSGGSRYPGSTSEPKPDLPRHSNAVAAQPKPAAEQRPSAGSNRTGTASRRSADVVAAGRGSSGASSGRVTRARATLDNDEPVRKSTPSKKRVHVVQRGDTLYRISRTYGVPVETLKQRNHLDSDLIRTGEQLVIR
jgi:LysM repeat protein